MSRLGPKLGELWRRIAFLRRGHQFDREMEEELRFHAAMNADAYHADGADAREELLEAVIAGTGPLVEALIADALNPPEATIAGAGWLSPH